jgi:hypothetical protein
MLTQWTHVRSGAKFIRSSDSAALVEVTNEAHLSYAKLPPVDHWIHPWSLSAIKARTKFALELAITLRELCLAPEGQTSQQTADLQAQFHLHWQAMAGLGNNPVQDLSTYLRPHWEFLRLWTGFKLSSSWHTLPCYGTHRNRNSFCVMRWPQIDRGAQNLNGI